MALVVAQAFPATPIITPFDTTQEITGIRNGTVSQIYNATTGTGLTQNLTSGDAQNSTIGGFSALLNPVETLFFPLALLWAFIQFVTGGFVFQLIGLFGMPSEFVFGLQGVIGILFARMIIYWVWGR